MADNPWNKLESSLPEVYFRSLVPVFFEPFAIDVAQRIAKRSPKRILEIAAGTGILTKHLLEQLPESEIVATDLNPGMVEIGRVEAPGADWQQADAMSLGFADNEFDLIVCQFGAMFFPDKPAAYGEAKRVLSDDGVLVLTMWDSLQTNLFSAVVAEAAAKLFPQDPPSFLPAFPYGYFNTDKVTSDIKAAGMECTSVEKVALEGHADSIDEIVRGIAMGTPLLNEIEARGNLDETIQKMIDILRPRFGSGPVSGEMAALVFEAQSR